MRDWFKTNRTTVIILIIAAVLFALTRMLVAPKTEAAEHSGDYAEYENAVVLQILADSTEPDETAEGAMRGEQLLLTEVKTGQYAGETMQVYNYVSPLYGVPLRTGDGCTLVISTYANGDVSATVYEFNRTTAVWIVLGLFLLITVLVGGRTGAKSLIGLLFTVAGVFWLLFPALMKGAPTLPTTFLLCVYVAAVSFTVLGGVEKKTVCAWLGTVAGMALALVFALLAQKLLRIDGLRSADVEPLLQLRQTGTPIGLRHLLVGGLPISALGAVMDVAMSLSSAIAELKRVNPNLGRKALWRSGMNVGRDMVGTMTNTLVLAFVGTSLVTVIRIWAQGPTWRMLLSSEFFSVELISALSSSVGVVLTVPLAAAVCAAFFGGKRES